MKRLFYVLLAAILFVACKNTEPELKLTLNPAVITCPDLGGDYTITLNAPAAWSAAADASWVKVIPTSGEAGTVEVDIKIAANKESTESKSKVVFTCGEETAELAITRDAKAPASLLVTSETEINTPKEGGTYTVMVESNIKWSISSNASWAHVSKGVSQNNDNITLTIDAATTPEETTAIIKVAPYGEGKEAGEQQILITRGSTDAISLVVDPVNIEASAEGGTFTVNVESNTRWKVSKNWDAEWIELFGTTESENNGQFGITVNPATSVNDATGIITVEEVRTDNYKPVIVQVTVTRKGKAAASLSVSKQKIEAPADGGKYQVTITSNYPWTATQSGSFFNMSKMSADGNTSVVVTVLSTDENKESTGSITIKSSFGNEKAVISVRREAREIPTLSVNKESIHSACEGGDFQITVESNTSWTITSSNSDVAYSDWISLSGTATLNISVPKAKDANNSEAVITIKTTKGNVIKKDINVTRDGIPSRVYMRKPFSISPTKKVYFSRGNLIYRAYDNTWSVTDQQFSFVGDDTAGNVYGNNGSLNQKSSNTKISSTYQGWIDLFGWGTGSNPTLSSVNDADYKTFVDWSVNTINKEGTYDWRTPSAYELEYILSKRDKAGQLRGLATVFGVKGYVLLPDDWVANSEVSFTPDPSSFDINNYTVARWQKLEAKGAVFLPIAGFRDGKTVSLINMVPRYWTSTKNDGEDLARTLYFGYSEVSALGGENCHKGLPVRLICDM